MLRISKKDSEKISDKVKKIDGQVNSIRKNLKEVVFYTLIAVVFNIGAVTSFKGFLDKNYSIKQRPFFDTAPILQQYSEQQELSRRLRLLGRSRVYTNNPEDVKDKGKRIFLSGLELMGAGIIGIGAYNWIEYKKRKSKKSTS